MTHVDRGLVRLRSTFGGRESALGNEIFDNIFVYHTYLPYCFQKMYDDKNLNGMPAKYLYLPLNRNYKPVGMFSKAHVNYEEYLKHFIRSEKPFYKIADVFTNDKPITKDTDTFYMYTDGSPASVSTYFSRLKRLTRYIDTIR